MRICNASISDEELVELALSVGYRFSPSVGVENAIAELETYKATRNLAIWHDHLTILRIGYILFAVWIVYDPIVFLTEVEYTAIKGQSISKLQEIIEEPLVYMIAPSNSSPDKQPSSDRCECLTQLSNHNQGYCGDKAAQQFERGTQLGVNYNSKYTHARLGSCTTMSMEDSSRVTSNCFSWQVWQCTWNIETTRRATS